MNINALKSVFNAVARVVILEYLKPEGHRRFRDVVLVLAVQRHRRLDAVETLYGTHKFRIKQEGVFDLPREEIRGVLRCVAGDAGGAAIRLYADV